MHCDRYMDKEGFPNEVEEVMRDMDEEIIDEEDITDSKDNEDDLRVPKEEEEQEEEKEEVKKETVLSWVCPVCQCKYLNKSNQWQSST